MAILHAATLTPTKAEVIASWLPSQSWAGAGNGTAELVGAYRFDDPEGQVGIEGHLVQWRAPGGASPTSAKDAPANAIAEEASGGEVDSLLHVPLTYRDAPLAGADKHLLGTMEHSVLGTRWVYDALADPVFTRMLAAVTMTGCGQAVGLVEYDGRWLVVPTPVQLTGGGWGSKRAAVDGLASEGVDDHWSVLRNDRIELRVARRPTDGAPAPISLTATWPGQERALTLAEVRARATD